MRREPSWRRHEPTSRSRSASLSNLQSQRHAPPEPVETIEVQGLRVAYRRRGSGPPIICVHGGLGDSRTWRAQLDDLSNTFTVIAWDAPGFGRSDDPPEGFGLGGYADCLAAFARALNLGRAHLVGLSFGGALAIETCRRHPHLVASLVLASAYAGWAGSLPAQEVQHRLEQAMQLADLPSDQLVQTLMSTMFSESAPTDQVNEFEASVRDSHPLGLREAARALARADLRDCLPTIAVPTLLLHGNQDVRAPFFVAEAIRKAISNSQLVVIRDAGHIVNIEAAARFNAEVRAFLHSIPHPSPGL